MLLASKNVNIPILCKDFIISEIQIENAFLAGADIILLIATILENSLLNSLVKYARNIGIEILFEIHKFEEFKKIERFSPSYIGVNNRDLNSMKINIKNGAKIISKLKKINNKIFIIAESGIKTSEHIKILYNSGCNGFLIGTSLMKTKNLKEKFQEFYNSLK